MRPSGEVKTISFSGLAVLLVLGSVGYGLHRKLQRWPSARAAQRSGGMKGGGSQNFRETSRTATLNIWVPYFEMPIKKKGSQASFMTPRPKARICHSG